MTVNLDKPTFSEHVTENYYNPTHQDSSWWHPSNSFCFLQSRQSPHRLIFFQHSCFCLNSQFYQCKCLTIVLSKFIHQWQIIWIPRVIHKLEESNHQVWFSSKHASHHKITAVEPYIFSCCAVWTHRNLWAIPTRFQSAFNDYPCSHLHPLPCLKCPLAHFSNLLRIWKKTEILSLVFFYMDTGHLQILNIMRAQSLKFCGLPCNHVYRMNPSPCQAFQSPSGRIPLVYITLA